MLEPTSHVDIMVADALVILTGLAKMQPLNTVIALGATVPSFMSTEAAAAVEKSQSVKWFSLLGEPPNDVVWANAALTHIASSMAVRRYQLAPEEKTP